MSEQRLLFDPPRSAWVVRLWRSIDPKTRGEIVALLAEMGRHSLAGRSATADERARHES
jgi:hypothetical protein